MPLDALPYRLTVRRAGDDATRFEYVVSRPGFEAVRSTVTYATTAAARDAGDARGRALTSGPAADGAAPRAP